MERAKFEPITETLKRFGRDILTIFAGHRNYNFADTTHFQPFEDFSDWPEPPHWPPESSVEAPNGWSDAREYAEAHQLSLYDDMGCYYEGDIETVDEYMRRKVE